ncbi:MAG: hypothetical protein Q8O87_03080 [bacterium]|nr:hypothetical protein [bacterium]
MKNKYTIHQILTSWGRQERRLPNESETLKQSLLAGVEPTASVATGPGRNRPWLSLALSGLAVFTLLIHFGSSNINVLPGIQSFSNSGGDYHSNADAVSEGLEGFVDEPSPLMVRPMSEASITDTREFLKTDYNAVLRTRSVDELTRRVETTVRGFGGRLDRASISPEYGFVSFIVPASEFELFRLEIESLVGSKFITTNINATNLLPQKQSIEKQQGYLNQTLSDLKSDRKKLVTDYNRAVYPVRSRLDSIEVELMALRSEQTDDSERISEIEARILELSDEQGVLTTFLTDVNAVHARKLNFLDNRMRNTENNLEQTYQQDQNLLDNVATVNGTITLKWISIWEIIGLYVPLAWVTIILAVTALISYIRHRRRYQISL